MVAAAHLGVCWPETVVEWLEYPCYSTPTRAGMYPFKPYPNRPGTMQYYAVPLDVFESGLELTGWARKAVEAAERSKTKVST